MMRSKTAKKTTAFAPPSPPANHQASLRFTGLPPEGKRYIFLRLVIVLFAAVAIILGAGWETFLLVAGVSLLFVIVVSALVRNLIG
jgi:hypothetical protein